MDSLVEALQNLQWWLIVVGGGLLVAYRYAEGQWFGQLLIGIALVVLAMTGFVMAEAVQFVATQKSHPDQVKVAVESARFATSVVWGVIGAALAVHSVSHERRR
jgi:hypothetical protein